jgi:hypothetical protein
MNAFKVTLKAACYTRGDKVYYKGFNAVIGADHPELAWFKRNRSFNVIPVNAPEYIIEHSDDPVNVPKGNISEEYLDDLGLDDKILEALKNNGINTFQALLEYDSLEKLIELDGIGEARAKKILEVLK